MPSDCINADMHAHSTLSVDANESVIAMCRGAVTRGLRYLGLTEHFDANPRDWGYGFFNYEAYNDALVLAQKMFADELFILRGLEFGEPHLYQDDLAIMGERNFDAILGAVHWIGEHFIGDAIFAEMPAATVYEKYFREVLGTVQTGGFDILAHLELPKRYLKVRCEPSSLVEEIMYTVVQQGIVLEINTSPLRQGADQCSPDTELLERYVAAGGCRVTIGSDAHAVDQIGAGWQRAIGLVREYHLEPGVFQNRNFVPL